MKKIYLLMILCIGLQSYSQNQNFIIDNSFPYYVNAQTLGKATIGGDTIFISSARTNPLRFQFTNGDANKPLVIINKGGQVKIDSPNSYSWGAITFENCKYIKISGAGHPNFKYGFELAADQCGLGFTELSSDCEAEFIKISHDGFFGIMAKKNYEGNPPLPYPVFENLLIHDCFIENVSEGMYLGETKSPGMEFKHVKIYNNIVRNTLRESIQIANMVEDVEIYNNTLINSGLENAIYQTSILQIGDNSVVNAYNNILIQAPSTAIAVYAKGPCNFTNNYMASNTGVFVDNRIFTDSLASININQNYFRNINGNQNIKNYNEINYVTAQDNFYDTDITFFLNQFGNSNNYSVVNNTLTSVPEIEFTDPSKNDYSLKKTNPIQYQNMGAPGGPEYFPPKPEQIVITPTMVKDLVEGGSVFSPLFLFDEQNVNIEADQHPISNSWKPDYTMKKTSYHVVIDLGGEYNISDINLHDMHNSYDLSIEYGDASNWTTLFVDPCNTFNKWSTHKTDITTRFLRLSMYQNVYAAVNEIIIYGFPVPKVAQQIVVTPDMITDLVQGGSVNSPLLLFDEQSINIKAGEHATSTSWKPYYTSARAPYYTIVDLGKEYTITEINLHDMHDTNNFTVDYGDPNGWTTLFVDPLDKFKFWNKHITEITTRYLRLSIIESPYAAVNEIIIFGYPISEELITDEEINEDEIIEDEALNDDQIIITSNMLTDLVEGGSVFSPLFLFDEQHLDYQLEEHPISNSWKPDYIMNKTSYHVVVDLGSEYHISKINLHDMHNNKDFTVEYGDATNWTTLFVDPCNTFNSWSLNDTDVTTRYLRLSMYQSVYAAVNEIVVFGNPVTTNSAKSETKKKAENISFNEENLEINNFEVFPNPVNDKLTITFPLNMIGKSSLVINDILGKRIYNTEIQINSDSPNIELKSFQLPRLKGIYTLTILHESGTFKTLKLFKNK
ncbi:T9SS type A sorting domain-containing protein [uncultured Polaribacter sp.]|uniref:T9SS type A sorting domain-containing protein n=1 Tax=uncultured Polaribacter sp. TaxID=174711 RepID=UPI0030D877DC|tara:strand:+ start:39938 stop:42802 length:2865 start_codon:yes stop_codon:yes gene_type:complete